MIGCGFVGSASVGKEALKFKKSADALKKVIETIGFLILNIGDKKDGSKILCMQSLWKHY